MIAFVMAIQFGFAVEKPEVLFRVNKSFVEDPSQLTLSLDVFSEGGVQIGYPRASGMSFQILDEIQTRTSSHVEQTIWFTATADPGSYVVFPPVIKWDNKESALGNELFIDIGRLGPRSKLADRMERTTDWSAFWGAVLALLCAGLFIVWRQREKVTGLPQRASMKNSLREDKMALSERIVLFRLYLESRGLGKFTVLTLLEVNQSLFTEEWEYPKIKPLIQEVLEVGERLIYAGQKIDEATRIEVRSKMEEVIKHLEER